MPLSQEAQQNILFSNMMGIDKASRVPVSQTRDTINHIPPVSNPTPVAEIINTTVPGADIPIRIYIPPGNGPVPVVSYYHGGNGATSPTDSLRFFKK